MGTSMTRCVVLSTSYFSNVGFRLSLNKFETRRFPTICSDRSRRYVVFPLVRAIIHSNASRYSALRERISRRRLKNKRIFNAFDVLYFNGLNNLDRVLMN